VVTTVGDLVDLLERWYPLSGAESWDRVGLVVGDRARPVRRVLCTVDVTLDVVDEGIRTGADLIVAHHPLLLRGVHAVRADEPKGAVVLRLAERRIALWCGHTNADSAIAGVAEALADRLGLTATRPMEERTASPGLDTLVTFVPPDHLDRLVDALASAGAGRVGRYDSCHFVAPGTGAFRPLPGADPYVGEVGALEHVAELRLEMVLPRSARGRVVEALLAAHPYETPAWHLVETVSAPADVGLGRVGTLPEPTTLAAFGSRVAAAVPPTAGGVRIGGDPGRAVRTVAVLPGAGDSLLDRARALGVDCYVTSDLRHHPAEEFLEWGRLDPTAPALVDVAHWAAEWPWLEVVAARLRADTDLPTDVSRLDTSPWSLCLGARGGVSDPPSGAGAD